MKRLLPGSLFRHWTHGRARALSGAVALWGLSVVCAFGWSQPHCAITKGALEVLPDWQKALLGDELQQLADDYCLIPDHVFTDRAKARYAMVEGKPREVYRLNLHLPAQQSENLETLRYFLGRAVDAAAEGNFQDAARYLGTVCHQIEDYGSPSHTMPGDNMFTLLQQFLPPSEALRDKLLHGPVESGEFAVSIPGYTPRLLGTTADEAAWRLMHRIHECILNARGTTIPIIQALYSGDSQAVELHQKRAAFFDAQVVADAVFTVLCLGSRAGSGLPLPVEESALVNVAIGAFFPIEAASLYYPQTQFFSSPHWGHPRSGVVLAEGNRALPLVLSVQRQAGPALETFPNGISAGMGRSLTFLLPAGVYSRFSTLAGLHPELGARGKVEFSVKGDGRVLFSRVISGGEPAAALECDIKGVSLLELALSSSGGDPKANYAIWADPVLSK